MSAVQELGVFSDEGCLEGSMWSHQEAEERRLELVAGDAKEGVDTSQEYVAAVLCEEHRDEEQRADSCEECHAELVDEEDSDDDEEE